MEASWSPSDPEIPAPADGRNPLAGSRPPI
jgi:hypothetical protein